MSQVKNPRCEIQIIGETTITINDRNEDASKDLYVDFSIDKDIEEEANEAELTIYNLSEKTRKQLVDSTNQSTPIEIYLTPYSSQNHSLVFKGEIETVKNRFDRPGHSTMIVATSQNENHRSFYFDRTYEAGTLIGTIVNDMVDAIGLPRGDFATVPTEKLLFAESFSGPAFPILRRYALNFGIYAYIIDGKLNFTDVYEITAPTQFEITSDILLSSPEDTTRIDRQRIDIETSALMRNVSANAKKVSNKKRLKTIRRVGGSEYVNYEAVDKIIEGKDFELFLQPGIDPDTIVEYSNTQYRVQRVSHYGNNYAGDWITAIETDLYKVLS